MRHSVHGQKVLESRRAILQAAAMHGWSPGHTQRELDEAQERYALRFPPDLIDLFLQRRPEHGYGWNTEDSRIRRMLDWPEELLLADVENGFWWPEWGDRPGTPEERREVVAAGLEAVPRLIPLIGHRFIPETPSEAGTPVFSMHGFDTIYYGANLSEFFANELNGTHQIGSTRHIPFWSDIVEGFEKAYAFYAASGQPESLVANFQRVLKEKGS